MKTEFLSWDSAFFDLKIGKIVCKNKGEELEAKLNKSKNENYSLLYVFTSENELLKEELIQKYTGKLVDRKVNFQIDLTSFEKKENLGVEDYLGQDLNAELLELTYLSGGNSRFLLDEKFPKSSFEKLYKTWIEKSLSGELADKVFVWKDKNKIVGFVTLKIKNNEAEIGLIAVSEKVQGQQIGTKLVDACVYYLQDKSISILKVPTQLHNIQACNFYKKYGFTIKSITNIYHFWL